MGLFIARQIFESLVELALVKKIDCTRLFLDDSIIAVYLSIDLVPYSWPSIAYVQFHYTGTVYISGVGYVSIDQTYACGGTLIDRSTGNCGVFSRNSLRIEKYTVKSPKVRRNQK